MTRLPRQVMVTLKPCKSGSRILFVMNRTNGTSLLTSPVCKTGEVRCDRPFHGFTRVKCQEPSKYSVLGQGFTRRPWT